MPGTTQVPNPAEESDGELTPEIDGQSTTVEEAMDAATGEEGFADESAYTPSAGSTSVSDVTPTR